MCMERSLYSAATMVPRMVDNHEATEAALWSMYLGAQRPDLTVIGVELGTHVLYQLPKLRRWVAPTDATRPYGHLFGVPVFDGGAAIANNECRFRYGPKQEH